jgi:hypothetical protein
LCFYGLGCGQGSIPQLHAQGDLVISVKMYIYFLGINKLGTYYILLTLLFKHVLHEISTWVSIQKTQDFHEFTVSMCVDTHIIYILYICVCYNTYMFIE